MGRFLGNFLFLLGALMLCSSASFAAGLSHRGLATYVQAVPLNVADWVFVGERRLEEGQTKYSAKFQNQQSGQELLISIRSSGTDVDRKDAGAVYGWDIFKGERGPGERQAIYNYQGTPLLVAESEKVHQNVAHPVMTIKSFPNEYVEFKVRGYKQAYPAAYQLVQLWYQNVQTLITQAEAKETAS